MAKAHCMAVARDPTTGASLLSATVNVYQPGTVTPVVGTLYDRNSNILTNPLTSDSVTGLIDFYMSVAQEVDLNVVKVGYTTRTYSNVPVLDDAGNDLTALLTTTGDVPYASAANTPQRLPIGTNGNFMTVAAGIPSWSNTISQGGLTITAGGLTVTAGNVGIGTAALSQNALTITETINAVGGAALGISLQPTLVATANNDTLAALLVQGGSVFNPNAKTGVSAAGLNVGSVSGANANNYGIVVSAPTGGTANNHGIRIFGPASGAGNYGLYIDGQSDVNLTGSGAIATNATYGFVWMPSCAGTPTGVPVNGPVAIPMVIDTTGSKIWVRIAGTWKGVAVA